MLADLDMNSQRILNLPSATTNTEPVTYAQFSSALGSLAAQGWLIEEQTATAGQTVFTLSGVEYTPGSGNLGVYINGVRQHPAVYSETSSSVVTLSSPGAQVGDKVLFEILSLDESASTVPSNLVTHISAGAGAVATTAREKLREIVSVKDFGAVGDGATDDTAAIQTAITAAAGKALHFPAGVYIVSGTLTVSSDDTRLVGHGSGKARYTPSFDGGGVTSIVQTTVNTSTVKFEPASSSTQYLYGAGISGISISYTSAAANTQTSGTGVTFTRCNGYTLDDVTVNDAFEGIAIKGGYNGRLTNFAISGNYIDRGGYPPSGYNGLLSFKSSSYAGTYQPCYVVEVSNFNIEQGKVRNYSVIIESADGLNFNNGYIGNAVESNVLVRPTVDGTSTSNSDYVSALKFTNVYVDAVTTTSSTTLGAKRCVTVTKASGTYQSVYDVCFGSGCYLANAVEDIFVVDYQRVSSCRISLNSCTLQNANNAAVVIDGPASSQIDLILSDCVISSVGDSTYGAVKVGDVRSLIITGNHFLPVEICAVYLLGTINAGVISGNYNNSVFSDLVNVATVTNRLVLSGNNSGYAGVNTWCGTTFSNAATSNANTLNWYQEGTFTPAVSFSGGTTGITYTSRTGTYTRIGNVVHVRINVILSSKGSSTGNLWVGTLPWTAANTGVDYSFSMRFTAITSGVGDTMLAARVLANGTVVTFEKMSAGSASALTDADCTNTTSLTISGSYFV